MATKYENYITGDDHAYGVYDVYWRAQTFTPSIAHIITSVKLLLYRVGSPSTITASIRATDVDGKPTEADLCSGTTSADTLTTSTAGEWREITLGAGTSLAASTMYAIVVRCPGGDGSTKYLMWRDDNSAPSYTGGTYVDSSDSGANWGAPVDTVDFMFEDWGDATGLPTVTTQATTSMVTTTATGNGNVTDLGDSAVTQHGHCWNTAGLPDTDDSKTTNGAKATTGAFTSAITGLTSGTLYYVRAYATNTDGTGYGSEVNFKAGAVGGELRGNYAVVEERFHYVDAYGVERFIQGEIVV